jgi:hypothetical protein
MAMKKNPSIYDDRGAIGSSDELDEYGVWVKTEPRDLTDSEPENSPVNFDPGLPQEESLVEELSVEDLSFEDSPIADENTGLEELEVLQDLQAPPEEAEKPGKEGKDLSTQLLMKIADELAAIKDELSTLKDDISVIRSEKPEQSGGFFDEEDDGKLALTGDELNNIIHTADFTEDTGADAGDEPPDEIPEDTDDLKALRENGAEPMTPPPEDMGYLEEDPLASEPLDRSDAIIDEPDLSTDIQETPLEEPFPDTLSLIDLDDMDEGDTPKVEENLFEDISLEDLSVTVKEDDTEISDGDLSFEVLDEDAELPAGEPAVTVEESPKIDPLPPPDLPVDDEDTGAGESDIDLDPLPPPDLPVDDEDIGAGEPDIDLGPLPDMDLPVDENTGAEEPDIDLGPLPDMELPGDFSLGIPSGIKGELKDVLAYMDKLLESLPEEKIKEFAQSEYYTTYKKLFEELGIE